MPLHRGQDMDDNSNSYIGAQEYHVPHVIAYAFARAGYCRSRVRTQERKRVTLVCLSSYGLTPSREKFDRVTCNAPATHLESRDHPFCQLTIARHLLGQLRLCITGIHSKAATKLVYFDSLPRDTALSVKFKLVIFTIIHSVL